MPPNAATLAQARARHPERFGTNHAPKILNLPDTAWINQPAQHTTRDQYDSRLTPTGLIPLTSSDAQKLTNMYMEALTDQVQCEEGVIDSITWCLYEVMDNVFAHSHAGSGYVMMQLHKTERRCVIAVADTGIGIQRSLSVEMRAGPIEVLRNPSASIEFALEQGATSKGGAHQGNGLYGLRRAVEINGGALNVTSGGGRWTFREGEVQRKTDRYRELPDKNNHQFTLVDWQLDCSRKVRIDEALGGSPINDFLEAIEDDEGVHRVSVSEIEESLAPANSGPRFVLA